jgi:GTP-binding protein EngB required for normal cell division
MKLDRFVRVSIAFIVALVFVIAIAGMLFISESALNVWDRLRTGPAVVLYIYIAIIVALAVTAAWLIGRLVVRKKVAPENSAKPLSTADIRKRLQQAEAAGVNTSDAQVELQELAASQASGVINLCFFGEISTGKSSLIKALVPEADVLIDAVGGSTTTVRRYRWRNDDGHEISLTDVPGTGGHEAGLDELATTEAKRSHLVVFVCDSDLTRPEIDVLRALLVFDKPIVLVLNKADRYSDDEQAMLLQKLLQRIDQLGGEIRRDHVVAVSAGGATEIVERKTDGSEGVVHVERQADIGVLVIAINRMLSDDATKLDLRRERAVFQIAAEKLEASEREYRLQRSEQIIRSATRKAVVGAMAAVSPGTDILVQGYIGTVMTQELCGLYGATPRDLDVEEFLSLGQSRLGKTLPLSLAVAGNGLKAFPGLGTIAGGLAHAVAYGLIFDALGRSLVLTLTQHGELVPATAAKAFEEGISEHLEAGVSRIAKMALDEKSG